MKDLTQCVMTPDVKTDGFEALGVATHRASTIVFKNAEAYATRGQRGHDGYTYGLYGTPTTRALEAKLTALEQGARTFLVPSGQAANAIAALPFLQAHDKILIADTAYPPMRDFANRDLARFGVEVVYYDPISIDDLSEKIDGRTKLVWCESPGSTTMEIQDLPAIASIAHKYGALVGCDNTWATPLNYKPLTLGADIVTEALTKYISGHSDLLMGSVTVRTDDLIAPVRTTLGRFGIGVSPDDASLVLRGMETLGVRLKHARDGAEKLIVWIERHPLVERVLYPSIPGSQGHDIWKRDFLGASGVFSVVLKSEAVPHMAAALDVLKTIAIGASWGGTRSLIAPMPVRQNRSATEWLTDDLVLRISVGLEDPADLQADIEAFFADIVDRTKNSTVGLAN
ncbi:trans-sulfuration enzyme family protein [Agrobacterium tumefaciens]|uniref:trans-sulfuration enzyme family protein n=1 Tax=Agrobacterium tumefaciens TaxID=358 RepID=UPI0021CFDD12|nr:PLP-dependent aspartate aminotransferase family protein [Agrobacterium tumefaciens]UXS03526.1 PLP-dependent transferase [Agrobacterium tumefaciens]